VTIIHRTRLLRIAAASSLLAAASSFLFGAGCEDRTGGDVPKHDGGTLSPGDGGGQADSSAPPLEGAADASSACPAGSTLRHMRTSCPGAPLSPPAAFTADLAAASPGDVVSMAGMDESTAPCLPVVVCTPGDAPTLLFSDSPESPSQDGVLYADTVAAGRYRLYVYHANGGTALRKFPVVALNQGALPAKITIVRRGLAAPSKAYVSVGKTVLLDWFVDRAPVEVTVPPGARVLLDDTLDQLHAAKDELVHAIFDVVVDRTVKISFVSVLAAADAAAVTAGLPLLPRDAAHQRGTFPAADVLIAPAPGSLADAGQAGEAGRQRGVQRLRLGVDEVDETLQGVDAPTGVKQALLGNYGMRYRFALKLPFPTTAALAPRGGDWGGIARIGGASVTLPTATFSVATTTDAIVLGSLDGGSEVELFSAGGSNLPVDLFLVTP
jgi:hypothetical protein